MVSLFDNYPHEIDSWDNTITIGSQAAEVWSKASVSEHQVDYIVSHLNAVKLITEDG